MSIPNLTKIQSENEQESDVESLSDGISDNEINDEDINDGDEVFQNNTTDAPVILGPSLDDDEEDDDKIGERFDKISNFTDMYNSRNKTNSISWRNVTLFNCQT